MYHVSCMCVVCGQYRSIVLPNSFSILARMASLPATFAVVVRQIVVTLAPTIFTSKSVKQSISRSAMLLCVFTVVHVAGNLTVLGGAPAFNQCASPPDWLQPLLHQPAPKLTFVSPADAHMLHKNKAFILVEVYLGVRCLLPRLSTYSEKHCPSRS